METVEVNMVVKYAYFYVDEKHQQPWENTIACNSVVLASGRLVKLRTSRGRSNQAQFSSARQLSLV